MKEFGALTLEAQSDIFKLVGLYSSSVIQFHIQHGNNEKIRHHQELISWSAEGFQEITSLENKQDNKKTKLGTIPHLVHSVYCVTSRHAPSFVRISEIGEAFYIIVHFVNMLIV